MSISLIGISLLIGFIAGSLPTGYLVGRIKGIDIRKLGSRNIGFTNIYRTMGPAWAVPVLVVDILKGILPVLLAGQLQLLPSMAGLGAIIGHIFTPWLKFRGGKGVATTIGVIAVVSPLTGLVAIAVYALVLLTTGYISVSSLIFAIGLAPLTAMLYVGDTPRLTLGASVGILIILRHTANIARLMRGEEPRFGLWLKLFRRKDRNRNGKDDR